MCTYTPLLIEMATISLRVPTQKVLLRHGTSLTRKTRVPSPEPHLITVFQHLRKLEYKFQKSYSNLLKTTGYYTYRQV